jgi:hypothetical protein
MSVHLTHESPEFTTHGSPEACLIKTVILQCLKMMQFNNKSNPDWDFKITETDYSDSTYQHPTFVGKKVKGGYKIIIDFGKYFKKEIGLTRERPDNVIFVETVSYVDAESNRDIQLEALTRVLYSLVFYGLISQEEFWSKTPTTQP